VTLSDFASFSTAVSGIAVTLSLVYLAIQTRQNSRHTRALIQQGHSARTTDITIGLQNADSVAAWIEGNGGTATPQAIRTHQFRLQCATAVNAMEDTFAQHSDGLMTEEEFVRNCDTYRGLLLGPGMRAFWHETRPRIADGAPKFCAFVDSLATGETEVFAHRV
jgi:hypothetical protein